MWGDRALGTREGGCMYSELGGDVCGEIGHLGHEKETVCIVIICMWGDRALGTREGGCMYCE